MVRVSVISLHEGLAQGQPNIFRQLVLAVLPWGPVTKTRAQLSPPPQSPTQARDLKLGLSDSTLLGMGRHKYLPNVGRGQASLSPASACPSGKWCDSTVLTERSRLQTMEAEPGHQQPALPWPTEDLSAATCPSQTTLVSPEGAHFQQMKKPRLRAKRQLCVLRTPTGPLKVRHL